MANKVYLIRHGLTEANLESRLVGSTDLPLNEKGRRQAEAMRPMVKRINAGVVFCSPMTRTAQTAKIALDLENPEMEMDDDLREVDFGSWEMMTFEEAWNSDKRLALKWNRGDDDFQFPEGERLASFLGRVANVHTRIYEAEAETALVFTHGGIIGQLICRMLCIPANRHMIFRIPPASITSVEFSDGVGLLTGICPPAFYAGD
jgi:broad specificity phosphatase PhoE